MHGFPSPESIPELIVTWWLVLPELHPTLAPFQPNPVVLRHLNVRAAQVVVVLHPLAAVDGVRVWSRRRGITCPVGFPRLRVCRRTACCASSPTRRRAAWT